MVADSIKMKRFIFTIILYLIFLGKAFADMPIMPYSYKIEVGGGKYVFIMLAEHSKPLSTSTGKQYASSGLYLNDGSDNPIWTIDWYALKIYISSDSKHLVRMGEWPSLGKWRMPNVQQLAVAFYENGRLLKQYYIADLISRPLFLPRSVSHFTWKKKELFNDGQGRLTIVTEENTEYVFDIKSGELIID